MVLQVGWFDIPELATASGRNGLHFRLAAAFYK